MQPIHVLSVHGTLTPFRFNTQRTHSIMDKLDAMISSLEANLNLAPGEDPTAAPPPAPAKKQADGGKKKEKKEKKAKAPAKSKKAAAPPADHPIICQIEFKVGVITKVWPHEGADKLWCEEIDVGEGEPRQICSGLRPYYTEEQMLGHRLLVVANLKAKNLKGFKSHGMVLCASQGEKVQFIEPPEGAPLGEVVRYEGLPEIIPASGAQVDKKKMFQAVAEKMVTNDKVRRKGEKRRRDPPTHSNSLAVRGNLRWTCIYDKCRPL